jgi:hypothetical protein
MKPMKLLKWMMGAALALGLAACGGGGGNSGTPAFGGGGGGSAATAADLVLEPSATQLPNTGAASVTLTVTAVDDRRVAVAGAAVTVQADNDGVLTQNSAVTDANGRVQATLTIGSNRANRVITLSVSSGSASRSQPIQVTGTRITTTLVPAVVAPSTAAQIQYRVVDQGGNPMAGQAITVSAPGLTPASASGTTGSNGDYTFNYTSSATAGNYPVAVTVGGLSETQTVVVQAAASVPPVTATITSATVSANPSVVGVNLTGSTTNRTEIRALFLGSNNQPVPNVRVRFDLGGDLNSIGGTFSTGSTTLYSDANGVVTTSYIPGTRSSPTNGVTVRACYGATDTDPNLVNCTNSATRTVTVVSEPLGVSIGTNELIVTEELTYTKRLLVSVADSAGNAMADVGLSVSLDLPQYRKGFWTIVGSRWAWNQTSAPCINEDTNRNGVRESGEDFNGNGRLDPGRSDVLVRLVNARTLANGTAVVEITYAKNFASWVDAWVTVSASGVSGTEGRATFVLAPVPVESGAVNNITTPPAFVTSPYGTATTCSNPN